MCTKCVGVEQKCIFVGLGHVRKLYKTNVSCKRNGHFEKTRLNTAKHRTDNIYLSRRASTNVNHSNGFDTDDVRNQPQCKQHRPMLLKTVASCRRRARFCISAGVRVGAVDPKDEFNTAISYCKAWDIVHACFHQMSRNALTSMVGRKGAPHFARFVEAKRRFSKPWVGT